jgi:hypothetical protein
VALRFEREESSEQKLRKLEGFVVQYGLPLAEAVPLFAALLSLPLTADYAPLGPRSWDRPLGLNEPPEKSANERR